MKNDNTPENQNDYKNKKITCKIIVHQQIREHEKSKFNNITDKPNKIWKQAKIKIFKEKNNSIDKIYHDKRFVQGSKKCSDMVNKFFNDKILNNVNKICPSTEDPMKHYVKYIKQPTKLMQFKEIKFSQMKSILNSIKKVTQQATMIYVEK